MSVPIPYQPPTIQRPTSANVANHPARRASSLLIVVALVFAVLGGLAFALSKAVTSVQFPDDTKAQIHQIEVQTRLPFDVFLRRSYHVFLGEAAIAGALGFAVRRGRRIPVVIAMSVIGLELMSVCISLLSLLPDLLSGGGAQVLGSVASCLVAIAVSGMIFSWLLQAVRPSRQERPSAPTAGPIELPPVALPRGLGYGTFAPPPPLPRRDDA